MKPKAHILLVEDKAMLYKRLAMFLKEENYSVSSYTPSYDSALEAIHKKKPDIALLDIDLEGTKTGLDLGETLSSKYSIPFIYVTDYQDDETFHKGLATKHEHFMVKTKPHLDTKELLRTIQTVLSRCNEAKDGETKNSLFCYTGYISDLKQQAKDAVSEVPVPYQEIVKLTTKNASGEKLKPNYVRVETHNKKSYYLPVSLTEIATQLPLPFARVNESEIVNLSEDILDGRINGTRLKIGKTVYHISKTYKAEVENRIRLLYHKLR
ncbi:response regulator transcription factor [Marinirhabdus gelatinilytica]|uniref:CheY-like chemotaxis protein n=1 Tax=Marinirhabdus gelatinilytica TaxID=1703343 RepID=A0A370Q651_9FLAO|nr:response regulator [Marinirhabdus gelatinilytica]RDK83836.1 CheY-like chemotaxis protein [Marinirhabdus gelatinilytica]